LSISKLLVLVWFGLWCLTPLSTIFQLYRGGFVLELIKDIDIHISECVTHFGNNLPDKLQDSEEFN